MNDFRTLHQKADEFARMATTCDDPRLRVLLGYLELDFRLEAERVEPKPKQGGLEANLVVQKKTPHVAEFGPIRNLV
jgi:hypothetical protein